MRCLAKAPRDRFQSAEELEAALAACADADVWTKTMARDWWADIPAESSDVSEPTSSEMPEATLLEVKLR